MIPVYIPLNACILYHAIFGNVGRVASEEVVLQLINTKCMPSLLYGHGLEACPLVKSELSSLDFVVNRFLQRVSIACYAECCISHDRFCLTV